MINIELFFDYACPYCYRGHKNLLNLLEYYPRIEITWRPCESHPYPETYFMHSDRAIQGMYYIQEHGGNLWKYHRLVYEACFDKNMDIASTDVLAGLAKQCGADHNAFKICIEEDRYREHVLAGNRYAWGENRLDAVPSYRFGKHLLGSRDGLLVPVRELEDFFRKAAAVHQKDGPIQ